MRGQPVVEQRLGEEQAQCVVLCPEPRQAGEGELDVGERAIAPPPERGRAAGVLDDGGRHRAAVGDKQQRDEAVAVKSGRPR